MENSQLAHLRFGAWMLLSISIAAASPVHAEETLEQAWTIALQRDHTVEASKQREAAAQYGVSAAKANRMPKIDVEGGYVRIESEPSTLVNSMLFKNTIPIAQESGYFSGISVSVPLFTSGRIGSGVDAASALENAAHAGSRQAQAALKLAVAEAYVAVLRAQRAIAAARGDIAAKSQHAADVRNFLEKGYVTRHDLLATEVALADSRQRELQAVNLLAMSAAAYNRFLGRSQASAVEIADIGHTRKDAGVIDLQTAIEAARGGRAELAQLEMQESALKSQADGVLAGIRPQLGATGGWLKLQNRYLLEDHSWWMGLALRWNLFDGGLARNQAAQISSTARSVAEARAELAELVELQVRQSWLALNEAAARIQVAEQTLAQADEALSLARDRYRSGLGPNSDVLDAQARRLQIYASRDLALYDRCIAELRLQYASGKF